MASLLSVRLAAIGLGVGLAASAVYLHAAEPSKLAKAKPLAREAGQEELAKALREGLDGRLDNRHRLLREAIETAPDLAAAHWHLGEIKVNQQWVNIDRIPELAKENLKLARYRKQRAETADTAAAQFGLANWCAKQGLSDEERAHLHHVVLLDGEHAQARSRLGFRMVAGQWISAEEQQLEAARALAAQQGFKKWEGKVQAIKKGFSAESLKARETALERARAIDDPTALSSLEYVLAPGGEQHAMLAVDVIGKIKGLDAARSLSRLAIVSPWQVVRNAAAQALKKHPRESFVPAMLTTLYSPVETRADWVQAADGRLLYRHLFYREGQDQRQLAVLDTEYRYAGGDVNGALAIALMSIDSNARAREGVAADQNRVTAELNDRIFRTLSIVTGESLSNDPQVWWKWWAETTEVPLPKKENRQFYAQTSIAIAGPTGGEQGGDPDRPTTRTPHEFRMVTLTAYGPHVCLAAGTLVTTELGPMAIEKIQVGDRVLAQDPKTGELAYKPVLRTTLSPATRLFKVAFEYDSFESTGGHLFWEPGKGWVKVSQFKAQTKLHRPTGEATIESVEEGRFDFTYNLVVADFHTYFVGKSQVLSHDITRAEATESVLPGLSGR